nr:hypothetical protein [Tanacetum cinerariifolium]
MVRRCRAYNVPIVEPNQHDDVHVVPKPVLVDEDEDQEEEEFKEEEDPQEEEDDMEIDIEEDKNEPELTYPYEEMDPLNPLVYEVGESSTAPFLHKNNNGLLPGLMRRDINSFFDRMASFSRRMCGRETAYALVKKKGTAKDKYYGTLIMELGNEVRSSMEQGTVAMERLVEKLGNAEDKANCKKLNNELEEARSNASGSGPARGHNIVPAIHECTFARFMKCNPTAFHGTKEAIELQRWFEKTESVFGISECAEGKKARFAATTLQGPALTWWNAKIAAMEEVQRMEYELWNLTIKEYNIVAYTQRFNELALVCPRMVKQERVKVDAYIRGLNDNIKGEVTSSKPANLNEAVRMAHKLMEQKSQARDERILEAKKRKQGNTRAMVIAPTDGKLLLCEQCFTRHVGQCTIKCHKCGKIGHKARYCKEKNVATGANALPILTCYNWAAHVARAPYKLGPSVMKELSIQLQELLEK